MLKKLLEKNPKKRIGNAEEIKKHKFFKEIEWNELEFKRIKDIKEKSMKDFKDTEYSNNSKYFKRIANFTFF